VTLEMEEDMGTLIILGRPFWATSGHRIDVKNGKLSFDVGDEHVKFNLFKTFKFPSISDECHMIDVVDGLIWETISNVVSNDSLKHLLLNNSTTNDEISEVARCAQYLEALSQVLPSHAKVEILKVEEEPSFYEEQAPKLELKSFPSSLRYEFLGPNSTYPMIVNASSMHAKLSFCLEYLESIEKP